jgi:hypothetical protein
LGRPTLRTSFLKGAHQSLSEGLFSGYGRKVYSKLFSMLPASPILAATESNDWLSEYVLPIGILLLTFLVPHIVAAQVFTPKSNILLVIAACVMQLLFVLLVAWIFFILMIGGWMYLTIGGVIVFVMSALVMTGIYRFEFVKGLGYNAIALLLIGGIAWGSAKLYPEVIFRRIATPIAMHAIRIVASFQKAEEAAQLEAVKHYPELAVAGSEFNRRFLERLAMYRAERQEELKSPGWPLRIAHEVGLEMISVALFPKSSTAPQPATH